MWRCIQNPESLWGREILSKYFPGNSITEWMRSTEKTYKNGSIGWKAMTLAYPLIGKWIAWKIGNKNRVRIGIDPWVGYEGNFKLIEDLLRFLIHHGFYSNISDVDVMGVVHMGSPVWIMDFNLNIPISL